jgi:hypothetical protein
MQEFMNNVARRADQQYKTFIRADRPVHFLRDLGRWGRGS